MTAAGTEQKEVLSLRAARADSQFHQAALGGNDTQDETFDLGDITELSNYPHQRGLRGVHHWSWDRDRDCAPGFAQPTCNSYGQAGTLGFTTRFLSALGL